MRDEALFLLGTARGIDKATLVGDETLKRAVVRSIEVIGEAAKNVPLSFREKYPHLDWRAMAGMRDRLIHGYFGIDYDVVWDVMENKASPLVRNIETILRSERGRIG